MNSSDNLVYQYQVGGSLPINAPSYVKRQADNDLYDGLKLGEFCYVLNSRQMGKSSLRVQTMQRLQAEGIVCAAIDITAIGTYNITPEQWYAGIIDSIIGSLELYDRFDLDEWWEAHSLLSFVQRFSKFIEEVLLKYISSNIVIFVDEIDSTLSLNFNIDDFFAVIRECYNRRADNSEYQRITFTIIGVATPSDLIQDKQRTPFNIGRAIPLIGFQLQEAEPLAKGLAEKVSDPQAVIGEVLAWTGGQPFLTQKLCKLVLTSPLDPQQRRCEREWVEELVSKRIIEGWESQDEPEHLRTIRDRILRNEKRASRLLGLYQQILQQGEVPEDDSSTQMELRLSGLVVRQKGCLRVANRIYEAVFNLSWVEKELANLRPYSESFTAWLNSNCQDESRLLCGRSLRDALTWSANKNLSNEDYRFLAASQELDFKEVQIALDLERKERESEQREAQVALEAEKKAREEILQMLKRVVDFKISHKNQLLIPIAALSGASLVLGVRFLGGFQVLDLATFDHYFRLRPLEPIEERIAIVTIDDLDIQKIGKWPIPDGVLAKAIENIKAQKPKAIGLDLYRDLAVPPGSENLDRVFKSTPNLIGIENQIGDRVPPPPMLSKLGQVGLAELVLDSDGKVRRGLMSIRSDNGKTQLSLGADLSLIYLESKGITLRVVDAKKNQLGLGKAVFQPFKKNDGGYVNADDGGYQVLLNFRGPIASFHTISFTDVLQNRIAGVGDKASSPLRDRIVLIGATGQKVNDLFVTTYSNILLNGSLERTPGVVIHANLISQTLSAALDERPLLWFWSEAVELGFIVGWAVVGSYLAWKIPHLGILLLSSLVIVVVIYLIGYCLFLMGGWIPVTASMFAFLVANASAISTREIIYIYEIGQLIKWINLKNRSAEAALTQQSSESKQ